MCELIHSKCSFFDDQAFHANGVLQYTIWAEFLADKLEITAAVQRVLQCWAACWVLISSGLITDN